jgi:ubiquinone/menaquinone biosynthesis C-methylase UbiE
MSLIDDFNRIARLREEGWDHNAQYHAFLLRQLPRKMALALDVGCGTGRFTRVLAERTERVIGLDIAPEMIRVATERSQTHRNIEYVIADASRYRYPREAFDCVASIATLHHLPLKPMLGTLAQALRPGGVLVVLDILRPDEGGIRPWDLMGALTHRVLSLVHNTRPPELEAAWEAHRRSDEYLSIREVRSICAQALPGAHVRRHLLWRYSIIWRKPSLVASAAIEAFE